MFKLHRQGFFRRKTRLTATEKLTPESFKAIAREIGTQPRRARKTGFVAARRSTERQRIETRWNGKESEITAEPGDWIVTTVAPDGEAVRDRDGHTNVYVIKPEKFAELYQSAGRSGPQGEIHRPLGTVEAIFLSGGFEIKAPWGETQVADAGYLLLNGSDVYGNHQDTFEASYRIDG